VRRARLLVAQGDLGAATRWTQENGVGADDEPNYAREPGHLVLARVLLAQDRPGPALALLDRMHAMAAAQARVGSLIEIGALRALGLAAIGEEVAAVNVLADALTLACPQGYVRVFADEGLPMAALLSQLIAAQRADQGSRPPPGSRSAAWPGSSAPLTSGTRGRASGPARPARRCRAWSSS
jgi:LuxR family maltose regulon positive regulatory protein